MFQADKERERARKEALFWKHKYEREVKAKAKIQGKAKALKQRFKRLEQKQKSGNVTRTQAKKVLMDELEPFFSRTQILAFLRKKKTWTKIRGWTSSDMSMALTIHLLSPRAYRHLQRNKILPLPGASTLRRYLQRFQIHEGFLDNVGEFLKTKIKTMSEKDRIVGIQFDEVHLKKTIEYDKATDSIVGPNSSSNVVLLRGIGGKGFKIPIWFTYGFKLTKEDFLSIVSKLTTIGFHVISSTCDMGPCNRGLAKQLGVTKDKPYVDHPDHPEVRVYWHYDVPHLLKLLRLHFLEKGFRLQSGTVVNKAMLVKVYSATKNNDITAGHHLTEGHLNVQRQDLQSVRKAAQVMSWRTASLIRLLAPTVAPEPAANKSMLELSNFIAKVDQWFDANNSYQKHDRKVMRCGLRIHHDKQVGILEDFYKEVEGLMVIGKSSLMLWQQGVLISIKATLLLYNHVRQVHGLEYVLTRRLNQDPLEQTFSKIRAMGGPYTNPGSLDFKRRLRLLILGGMNNVFVQGSVVCPGFDDEDGIILTLDDMLNGFQKLEEAKASTLPTTTTTVQDQENFLSQEEDPAAPANAVLPPTARDVAIAEGMKYVTGFLLQKVGWEDKLQKGIVTSRDMVESKWIDALNTGGLSYPARSIVDDVKRMDAEFVRFHKEANDGLLRVPNVTKAFSDTLAFLFPDYPLRFIHEFSFARTMWRLRQVRLDLSGSRESARSKKKCIEFGY